MMNPEKAKGFSKGMRESTTGAKINQAVLDMYKSLTGADKKPKAPQKQKSQKTLAQLDTLPTQRE